ncbi:TPA: hypothetical protein ACSVZR_003484 [Bacillus cereus]
MSKVNVDEIQVGDLVEIYFEFEGEKSLGYVIDLYSDGIRVFYSDWLREDDVFFVDNNIIGHWKVINFEEESKMNDELKVYTGKETLQALLEGKTLKSKEYNTEYKMIDELLHSRKDYDWNRTVLSFNVIYEMEFTEVVTPKVGDWVKVCDKLGFTSTGLITSVTSDRLYGNWNEDKGETYFLNNDIVSWEILSPEQVSEYKRELAFSKVGRKLNEFKHGDIVFIDALGVTSVVITKKIDNEIKLHGINEKGKGYTARPHQLTPISFVENQVDLS